MPEKSPVRLDRHGAVARVRFDRPDVLNVLDETAARAFLGACRAISLDASVRVVLLEGEGRAFMAGGDISRFAAEPDRADEIISDIITPLHQALLLLHQGDRPVIAALQGAVAGAGMSLAMAADLAVAADNVRFVFAYTQIGASPDGSGSFFLPRLVGLRRAMQIALLGEPIGAEEALSLGLVNRVVPADRLEDEALALAERLARGPTRAFGEVRRLYERSFGATLADQLEAERQAFMRCARSKDFAEGVAAFRARREAVFNGC